MDVLSAPQLLPSPDSSFQAEGLAEPCAAIPESGEPEPLAPALRVGILLDPADNNDWEAAQIMAWLTQCAGLDAELAWRAHNSSALAQDPLIDLLVFDYGALHRGSRRGVRRWTSAIEYWCNAHPGKLALAWSACTGWIVADLAHELGAPLDNLLVLYDLRVAGINGSAVEQLVSWYGISCQPIPEPSPDSIMVPDADAPMTVLPEPVVEPMSMLSIDTVEQRPA